MYPISLNEFLLRNPAILRLRLRVDEAAVAVKYAHVTSLRALTDKNVPLITRWHEYFRKCEHGHQIFIGAFYKEMTSSFSLRSRGVREINAQILKRKMELDECMIAIENAEAVCDRVFHEKNATLFLRWQEHFENCRARYLKLLRAFRYDFLNLPPSVM